MKKYFDIGSVWTLIIGIIGFGLAFYFYNQTKFTKEIVFGFAKSKTLLYNNAESRSSFSLLDSEGQEIKSNVYLTHLSIWNNGNLPISLKDIRNPIRITIDNGYFIEDLIINGNFLNIAQFDLKSKKTELELHWKYFDPEFGFRVQLIFAGNSKTEIKLIGHVLDCEIREVEIPKGYFHKIPIKIMILFGTIVLMGLILALALFRNPMEYRNTSNHRYWVPGIFLGLILICLVIFAVMIYQQFFQYDEFPPFI